jgi:anaerobic ribonucleoside-triphosphate reductase
MGKKVHMLTKDKIEWAKAKNDPRKSVCKNCGAENSFKKDKSGYYCTECGAFR